MLARRFAGQPAWAAVTEVFIGIGWLRAVVAKTIDPEWWTGESLEGTVAAHADLTLAWYQPFIDIAVLPWAALVALLVLIGQWTIATTLLSGRRRGVGLALGTLLNLNFVAAGIVNPSAFYLVAQGALALWLVDGWRRRRRSRLLPIVAALGLLVAAFNLPFITTVDPAVVVEDPAAMFVTIGALTTLGALLGAVPADEHTPG